MKTRTMMSKLIERAELCPGATSLDAWLSTKWIKLPVGRRLVPVIPLWGLRKALVAHDVHHALLGYSTSLRSELALAAWELSSGGCGWNLPFWIDRGLATALGLIFCPRQTWRALRLGCRSKNLYGMRIDRLLDSDIDDLRRQMQLAH